MSSPETIVNQALAEIGARATINSFEEASTEAVNAKIFYNPIRQKLLRMVHWGFARRQGLLTLAGAITDTPPASPYPWPFKYVYPADCIRVRYIITPPPPQSAGPVVETGTTIQTPWWWGPSRANRFLVHNEESFAENGASLGSKRYLLSNVQNAIGCYTADVTDVSVFDELFYQAFVQALAAKFSLAISGNVEMKQAFEALADATITVARAADGNEALPTTDHVPDWIKTRGVPAYAYSGPWLGANWDGFGSWFNGWDSTGWGM